MGSVTTATDDSPYVEYLPPGSRAWQRIGHEDAVGSIVDLVELPDGRVAVGREKYVVPGSVQRCDLWNPATGTWTQGSATIPSRRQAVQVDLPPNVSGGPPIATARLSSGALLVVGEQEGGAPFALRLDEGAASSWREVSPPPVRPVLYGLRAGGTDGAVLVGADGIAVFARDAWTTLPPLVPPRLVNTAVVLRGGGVVAAGGSFRDAQRVTQGGRVVAKIVAALLALALLAFAAKAMIGSRRPRWTTVAAGLAVGWILMPALALVGLLVLSMLLEPFAWH